MLSATTMCMFDSHTVTVASGPVTRVGTYRGDSSPCPSLPCVPAPQVNSTPASVTAMQWSHPQATWDTTWSASVAIASGVSSRVMGAPCPSTGGGSVAKQTNMCVSVRTALYCQSSTEALGVLVATAAGEDTAIRGGEERVLPATCHASHASSDSNQSQHQPWFQHIEGVAMTTLTLCGAERERERVSSRYYGAARTGVPTWLFFPHVNAAPRSVTAMEWEAPQATETTVKLIHISPTCHAQNRQRCSEQ